VSAIKGPGVDGPSGVVRGNHQSVDVGEAGEGVHLTEVAGAEVLAGHKLPISVAGERHVLPVVPPGADLGLYKAEGRPAQRDLTGPVRVGGYIALHRVEVPGLAVPGVNHVLPVHIGRLRTPGEPAIAGGHEVNNAPRHVQIFKVQHGRGGGAGQNAHHPTHR